MRCFAKFLACTVLAFPQSLVQQHFFNSFFKVSPPGPLPSLFLNETFNDIRMHVVVVVLDMETEEYVRKLLHIVCLSVMLQLP